MISHVRWAGSWYNGGMSQSSYTAALDRLLDPLEEILTPEVARQIVDLRADGATQRRIDELAEKSTEGQLSAAEEAEYDDYVEAIDIIGILQAKARSALARHSLS
jgi:hypothetical protein